LNKTQRLNYKDRHHTPNPPGEARKSLHVWCHKMLASTIQLSTTQPTNTHHHTNGATASKGGNPIQRPGRSVIPQSPTVCHTHPPHRPPRFHAPPPRPQRAQTNGRTVLMSIDPVHGPSSTIPLVSSTIAHTTMVRDIMAD
jgi:hypothetical protein